MVLPEATVAETIEVTSTVAPTPVAPSTTVPSPPMFPTTTVPAGDVILQTTTHHPSVHVSAVPLTAISMVSVMSANRPQLQRPALRVMCVVDTSGSMGQEGKIDAVRSALHYVVASLSPSDEFGLVSFSNSAVVNLAMTRVLPSSVPHIGATIARLPARGNTNLSGGLLTAIQVLHPAPRQSPYAPARCMPPTVQPYGVVSPIPSFYLMATRMPTPGPTGATVMVQGVLPAMASHLEVTAVGQLGAIRCTPGVPTAVWPDVPLTFTVVLKNPNSRASFAPQTVELHPGAPVHLSFTSSSVPPAPTNPTIVSPANAKALDLVLLFTDGEANVGVTDPSTLSALMTRTLAQCGSNASFVTFGFGTSHNATLLRTLATGTQGTYYFVPSSLDIPKLFGDCLGGFMSVVARNIVVRVQPVSSLVAVTGVRSSYPVSRDHTGVFRVQLKDLFAEERRDLIVDVTIDAAALVAPLPALPWFTVTVTSEDPRGVTTSSGAISVEVPVVQLPYVGVPNVAVEEQVGRLVAAEAIEAATNLATAGDFLHAREYLARARFAQPVAASSFARCVSSELAAMDDFMDAARWAKGGAMNANTMQAQHAQQRCSAVNAPSAAHYQTKAKSEGAARAVAFAKNASAVPPS